MGPSRDGWRGHERHPLPRRHADREPRRPLRPCPGDARRGDGRRGGGHAADRSPPAVPRHPYAPGLDVRGQRGRARGRAGRAARCRGRRRGRHRRRHALGLGPWVPHRPARRGTGDRGSRRARPVGRDRRPRPLGTPDGPVRVRGIPPAAPGRSRPPAPGAPARPADDRLLRIPPARPRAPARDRWSPGRSTGRRVPGADEAPRRGHPRHRRRGPHDDRASES